MDLPAQVRPGVCTDPALALPVDVMEDLYNYVNPLNSRHSPMVSKETLDIVMDNKDVSACPWAFWDSDLALNCEM